MFDLVSTHHCNTSRYLQDSLLTTILILAVITQYEDIRILLITMHCLNIFVDPIFMHICATVPFRKFTKNHSMKTIPYKTDLRNRLYPPPASGNIWQIEGVWTWPRTVDQSHPWTRWMRGMSLSQHTMISLSDAEKWKIEQQKIRFTNPSTSKGDKKAAFISRWSLCTDSFSTHFNEKVYLRGKEKYQFYGQVFFQYRWSAKTGFTLFQCWMRSESWTLLSTYNFSLL